MEFYDVILKEAKKQSLIHFVEMERGIIINRILITLLFTLAIFMGSVSVPLEGKPFRKKETSVAIVKVRFPIERLQIQDPKQQANLSPNSAVPSSPTPVKLNRGQEAKEEVSRDPFLSLYEKAKAYLGVPYIYGGNDPRKGLDCSAFVQLVFRQVGIELPRSTYGQIKVGQPVKYEDLRPGDLVFFSSSGPGPSHVGIFIGNGQMINETEPKVQISRIDSAKRKKTFYGARRIKF